MAAALDGAYVDHRRWTTLLSSGSNATLNRSFRVTGAGASLNGKRILYVGTDPAGSLFIPGESVESPTGWDIIRFTSTMNDTIEWIHAVAHETGHAFARVTAAGPAPASPAARVRAAVRDECDTRRIERQVVLQIRATQAGRRAFAGRAAPAAPRTCDCERDWFPSAQKRTYLEHFVLGADWEAAARPLTDVQRQKILADVAKIPVTWRKDTKQPVTMAVAILRGASTIASFAKQFPVLKSPAGQAAFALRLVDASWRQLIAKVGEGSATWTGGAHRLRLERHAKHLFRIPVTYTACP